MTGAADGINEQRTMVLSGAMLFAGGTFIDLIESLVPGGQAFSLIPGVGSVIFGTLLISFGMRLPRLLLGALGPLGVALIAIALATTTTPGDGAVLYMWPVLWQAHFFGRRGTLLIVASVGVCHAVALALMTHGDLDRWIDVMSAVSVVGAVVELLSARNRRLLEHISAEARVDELTQLLNRRGFDEGAARELAAAARDQSSIGVALFDLDHFKHVNDQFGHEAGDRVLRRFAECLSTSLRATDIAARLGGEEFVALLPGADLDQVREYTERVRDALGLTAGNPQLPVVTVSAGASAAVAPESIDCVLRRADMALYAAKSRGRDRTVLDDCHGAASGSLSGLEIGQYSQHAPMVA
ncbi:MAG TPA: GGDEF domain-containing protein [Solirubrobacteraceae bacterium]|jgi:diguanylate cyclase (GGDEF)-like protein|nr:GGDEF domain-containing protein [Solirubrobacteraceae bacterium]